MSLSTLESSQAPLLLPLGISPAVEEGKSNQDFESFGQTPLGGCSQVPVTPSDTKPQTGSIPTSGGPQPHRRGGQEVSRHVGTQSSEDVVPRAQSCQRQQLSSGRARAALGHSERSRSAGSPRGPRSWSPSIQIHRHTSLAWLLPRPAGRCLPRARQEQPASQLGHCRERERASKHSPWHGARALRG